MSAAPIIVENVSKYYKFGVRGILIKALDGVSFSMRENEVLGLIGANGAGKSTLIKIIIGAARASSGRCLVFGAPLSRKSKTRIGYLPEAPYFYKFLTGFELVRFYAKLSGMSSAEAKTAAMRALNLVGLGGAADRRVGLYSKGMLQRAGLAQAIVHNPDLVILDEPASGLDPAGAADMAEIILRLKREGTPETDLPRRTALAQEVAPEWLARHDFGLDVDADSVQVEAYDQFRFVHPEGGKLTLARLDLRGTGTVRDAQALRQALYKGIGRARGFGFGLLLVRRIGGL